MDKNFLTAGEQTDISIEIRRVASSLAGGGLDYVFSALRWLAGNLERRDFDVPLFRRRTATEVIESGFVTGCGDSALTFVALCRAKGIPASWLETASAEWLRERPEKITGHIFSRVLLDDHRYLVDPHGGVVYLNSRPDSRRWVILDEGLDSWDLGIKSFSDLKKRFLDFEK